MKEDRIQLLLTSDEKQVDEEVIESIRQEGYAAMSRLIDQLKERIKQFTDEESEQVLLLLERAVEVFPEPGKISPAWQTIWDELTEIVKGKMKVLALIPKEERDGEWQVIIDNPFMHSQVVCYPALTFMEAAYLYGYFLHDLHKNEYIRLQKVQQAIVDFGGSASSEL